MTSKRLLCALVLLLAGIPRFADASTFVGNGGNTADLQLQVTLVTIHRTADLLDTDPNVLCSCPIEWTSGAMCESLRSLSSEEADYCREILTEEAETLAEMSAKGGPVTFRWSNQDIATAEPNGKSRDVDALVVKGKKEIIINRERFLQMTAAQRVSLITHELFHIIPIEDRLVSDSESVGPFERGSRLLDTLGAAVVIESIETGVKDELRGMENISRSNKDWWIYLDWKSLTSPEESTDKRLRGHQTNGTTLALEYRPSFIGLRLIFDGTNFEGRRSDIEVREKTYSSGLGVTVGGTPFDLYLSRWTETQLLATVGVMRGTSEYEVFDDASLLSDSSDLRTTIGKVEALIPIYMGFWLSVGGEARSIKAKYEKLGITVDEVQSAFSMGASYGF